MPETMDICSPCKPRQKKKLRSIEPNAVSLRLQVSVILADVSSGARHFDRPLGKPGGTAPWSQVERLSTCAPQVACVPPRACCRCRLGPVNLKFLAEPVTGSARTRVLIRTYVLSGTMVATVQHKPIRSRGPDPEAIWYVSNRRVRSKSAASEAIKIVKWITNRQALPVEPDEHALFVALHTCGYRAARPDRAGKCISNKTKKTWARRWQIIRDYIIERNLGLVYLLIHRSHWRWADPDDLLSEGMFALLRSVERFDPWKGYRFSTYACNAIVRGLMRVARQESRYRQLFPVQHDADLERPVPVENETTQLCVDRLKEILSGNWADLSKTEMSVLEKRFPLGGRPRLTFDDIGSAVGLSKERIRQIQNAALKKIRNVLSQDPVLQ